MPIKIDDKSILIKDLDITVRCKTVLETLGIITLEDLHVMHLLDAIPKIGTRIRYIPFARNELIYSAKVDKEIKQILETYSVPK